MTFKTTALVAMLVPGLAMMAACNRDNTTADDMTAPAATAPADTMPSDTMPADTTATDAMPADTTATDAMPADTTATDSMPADTTATDAMPADSSMASDNMSFADMDKNHDGSVAKDELPSDSMLAQHFSTADTDGDGKLSEAEISKHEADMKAAPAK